MLIGSSEYCRGSCLITQCFIDIPFPSPVACERGGRDEDYDNYPRMMGIISKTFAASGHDFGIQ